MALKRKRSFSDNTSPLSTSSYTTSTSSRASQSPTPTSRAFNSAMDLDTPIPSHPISSWSSRAGRITASDLNSRTRKRFRDNRPDEHAIHENTISKLFSAQREFPHAEPVLSQPQPPLHTVPSIQKSTLHSFWKIGAPPSQPAILGAQHRGHEQGAPRCEDCDGALQRDDDMDVDFEGLGVGDGFGCQACGRRICDTCAVVGDARVCLQCANAGGQGRRGW